MEAERTDSSRVEKKHAGCVVLLRRQTEATRSTCIAPLKSLTHLLPDYCLRKPLRAFSGDWEKETQGAVSSTTAVVVTIPSSSTEL